MPIIFNLLNAGSLHCHRLTTIPIGFIAMDQLLFRLVSLPWVHCCFTCLYYHWFIAILIGLIAFIKSQPIWLASLPFLGYIAFPVSNTAAKFCLLAPPHLPFGAPFAFWHLICLLVPHLPFGAPFAFWHPICRLAPHLLFGTPFAF